jgi:serine/threonine-protein kinase
MGTVYLGYDDKNARQVALKVLTDHLVANQTHIDRFYREARSGSHLNHPNIVRTFSFGQDLHTGKYYLVLEYVEGPSAQALLARYGQLSVADAVHIGINVARALEHAHSRNIVHRDIKPDNLLITRSGLTKLGDFGLAKRVDEASHLTQARQGFGTTAYMPYEQAINAKYADGRSDLYALGATLYHLLTGQVPFPGENHLEVIEKKSLGEYAPASSLNPAIPVVLDQILGRMLEKEPRDRYQTASELIIDLERSRLAAEVPSFADADLARQDPWVQAYMNPGEPTRLDPQATSQDSTSEPDEDDEWIVHYRNRAGRPFAARLSTGAVIERLQKGTLPLAAEVRRPAERQFQALSSFGEFRPYLASLPPETSLLGKPRGEGVAPADALPTFWSMLLAATGLAVLVLLFLFGLLSI